MTPKTQKLLVKLLILITVVAGVAFTFFGGNNEVRSDEIIDQTTWDQRLQELEQVEANTKMPDSTIAAEAVKPERVEAPKEAKQEAKQEATPVTTESKPESKYFKKWFGKKTGQTHVDMCQSNDTGKKFMKAFAEFGADAQVVACVTLNHENGIVGGDYITNAVSPCWSTAPKLAQKRQCTYASDNSKGVDAGLFMINTYYQSKRISKLGGPSCTFEDSKNAKDPCNVKKIAWLHNLDNQIKIILDIYREQGFEPWVAYKKHVKPYV
jgi:hypothetical protein